MTARRSADPGGDPPAASLAGELRTVVNRLAHHLRTPGVRHGITPTRLTALAVLSKRGPVRQGDLAGSLGISAASTTRLADVLVEQGWVERRPDPTDQRACQLALTAEGTERIDALRSEGTSQLSERLQALTPEERAVLGRAIPILRRLADHYLDAPSVGSEPLQCNTSRRRPRDERQLPGGHENPQGSRR